MLVSIAEEMNPTRRNAMEDVHVFHAPTTWDAPDDHATFIGVYDGHGGRLIVDYLEDHLASNVATEWRFLESEHREHVPVTSTDGQQRKKRRLKDVDCDAHQFGGKPKPHDSLSSLEESKDDKEGKIIQTSLERAFLLTDIQSRMAGLTTSGATVVCCIVVPKFSPHLHFNSCCQCW